MRLYWVIPFIVLSVLIAVIWNEPVFKFSETLPVKIIVSDPGKIGVYTAKEPQKIFDFGITFPGTKVQKTMNLTRGKEPPAKIHITVNGMMQNWTILNKNDFVLDDPTQVEVTIMIPDDAQKGTYRGV